jgi:hypothetical protein
MLPLYPIKIKIYAKAAFLVHHCFVKATTVPHPAMAIAITRIIPSNTPQRLSRVTFAMIGPMMQSKKAEKDPRNAIIELNSGIEIETKTESNVTVMRCTTATHFLGLHSEAEFVVKSAVLSSRASTVSGRPSIPSRISIVALSWKVKFRA